MASTGTDRASWDLNLVSGAFAAAAVDPSQWQAAMDTISAATGSVGAILLPVRGRIPAVPFSDSLGPLAEAYFGGGWVHRDERYRGLNVLLRNGVFTDLDFTDLDEINRHPFYQEFLAPHGLRWFAGVKIAFGDELWCVAIQRSIAQGPLSPSGVKKLAEVSRRLGSAGALACALSHARAEAALAAFELSGSAVGMLDHSGEVVRLNPAAERILGADLFVRGRRLASFDPEATAALDRALHAALWSPDPAALLPPIVLPRREGRPILAYPSRPAGIARDIFAPCRIIVVLVDLEPRPKLIESELRQAFRLTAAEARLANRMLGGESVEGAANALGIRYETARNTLKSVLQKTDTHRQGELIALLGRFAFRTKGA